MKLEQLKGFWKGILPGLILLTLISCSEEEGPIALCGGTSELDELAWVQELIDELEKSKISREFSYLMSGDFEGTTYLYLGNCCPYCNSIPVVYDCQGNRMEDSSDLIFKLDNVHLVYKSDSNSCQLDT